MVLHELAHGLGFMGSTWVEPATAPAPTDPARPLGRLVSDADGRLVDAASGTADLADRLQGDALRWTGAWGTRANGGKAPSLYAPPVFEPGSSLSHLDEATYPQGSSDSLMTPMLANREVVREPGSLARGLLRDLGWRVTPERAERGAWSPKAGAADVAERRADGSVDLRTWTSAGLSRRHPARRAGEGRAGGRAPHLRRARGLRPRHRRRPVDPPAPHRPVLDVLDVAGRPAVERPRGVAPVGRRAARVRPGYRRRGLDPPQRLGRLGLGLVDRPGRRPRRG